MKMVERLQVDSTLNLEQHRKEVSQALAAASDSAAEKARPDTSENPFLNETITAALGGKAFSIFMVAQDEMRNTPGNSLFVGGAAAAGKVTRRPTPIMPLSYSDKKMAARREQAMPAARKGDIVAHSRIAGMSLTGRSTTDKKQVPIKGVLNITPGMAAGLGVSWLLDELRITDRAMQNPYDRAPKRLLQELEQGIDRAEEHVRRTPQLASTFLN